MTGLCLQSGRHSGIFDFKLLSDAALMIVVSLDVRPHLQTHPQCPSFMVYKMISIEGLVSHRARSNILNSHESSLASNLVIKKGE